MANTLAAVREQASEGEGISKELIDGWAAWKRSYEIGPAAFRPMPYESYLS